MKVFTKKLAENKFFVPIIILTLVLMVISSLIDNKECKNEETVEEKLEAMCNTIYGVRNAKVMITYEATPVSSMFENNAKTTKIQGVAISCEGGGNPNVQLSLYNMLKALFGLSSTQITVSERKPPTLS